MRDFSKCPSCKAAAIWFKNGTCRYNHKPDCRVGTLIRNGISGTLGDPRNLYFPHSAFVCTKCRSTHTVGSYPSLHDESWLAINTCPICWAVAEALTTEETSLKV